MSPQPTPLPAANESSEATQTSADFGRRVVYALLGPVVRLAEELEVPLKHLQKWVRLAYFQELRARGMRVADASRLLAISEPTAARLSRELKTTFLAPEAEHELPKRIAFMLWSQPLSRARIVQALGADHDAEIDAALGRLVTEGRITLREGRTPTYELLAEEDRLVQSGWPARIGALSSLLGNLSDVVQQRFFDESAQAFARTVSFRVRKCDEAELGRFYREQLWPFLRSLEDRARQQSASRTAEQANTATSVSSTTEGTAARYSTGGDEGADGTDIGTYRLSVFWAPYAVSPTATEKEKK